MPRILSVWCRHWPITTWRRRNGGSPGDPPQSLRDSSPKGGASSLTRSSPSGGGGPEGRRGIFPDAPFALLVTEGGTRRLAAVDEVGLAMGLFVGQKAADAAALCPELVTADFDPEGDRAALETLVDWCVRMSPAVALDGADGLFLDIDGVDHLWGGEAAMLDDLLTRLAAAAIPARAAIADTPGAAWALARFGPDRAIAPPGGQRALLAGLPVAGLRLDEAAQAQLPRLGLFRVGQLLDLPRAQLARRFGAGLLLRLDQALGDAREALTFRRPVSPWFARLAFAEPISTLEDLARATGDITAKLCARLETEGRGARRFELTFHRLDGRGLAVRAGLSRPGRDAVRLTKLLVPKLDTLDPGFGIEVVTLTAEEVEPLSAPQGRLDAERHAAVEEGLAPLIDRLTNRLGEDRVWRAQAAESHVPERAVVRRPPLASSEPARWDPDRPRPVRLFSRPEAITALAKLPDDPPAQFTWRGQSHRVRRAEGPERLAEEWWRKPLEEASPSRIRDYYRVEDEAGGRFWIFRAGLYADGETPKWWLHGLFG